MKDHFGRNMNLTGATKQSHQVGHHNPADMVEGEPIDQNIRCVKLRRLGGTGRSVHKTSMALQHTFRQPGAPGGQQDEAHVVRLALVPMVICSGGPQSSDGFNSEVLETEESSNALNLVGEVLASKDHRVFQHFPAVVELADRAVQFSVGGSDRDRCRNKAAEDTPPKSRDKVLVTVELEDNFVPWSEP